MVGSLWDVSQWPLSPAVHVLCHPHPLSVGGTGGALLSKSIWQSGRDVTSMIKLRNIVMSVLLAHSIPSQLSSFDEASCRVGKSHGKELRPWASSPWGTEFCQQPPEPRSGSFPSPASRCHLSPGRRFDCSLMPGPEQRAQRTGARLPTTETVTITGVLSR